VGAPAREIGWAMGYIPSEYFNRAPVTTGPGASSPDPVHPHGCVFCARRFAEMYLLPSFGLGDVREPDMIACADCYEQVTFTSPRAAARVVLLD